MAESKEVASVQRALRKVERTKQAFLDHGKKSEGSLDEKFAAYQKARKALGRTLSKVESV